MEYLKEVKKLKYWSIQVYCAALLHFFEMNDVVLNTKKIKRFLPNDEGHYNQDRPYSTDEIVKILDKCDIRSRVIIKQIQPDIHRNENRSIAMPAIIGYQENE